VRQLLGWAFVVGLVIVLGVGWVALEAIADAALRRWRRRRHPFPRAGR
jgi:hypothetical protein